MLFCISQNSYTCLTQIGPCAAFDGDFDMAEHHELMGGKLHVYKRENSRCWQCSTHLNGKNWRVSTKEESLQHAKDFAEDWYLELKGKHRAGVLKAGRRFSDAADRFLEEFEIITQ